METFTSPPSSSVLTKIKHENNVLKQHPKPITAKISKIEKEMATLTMARVLKSQRHYQDALSIIDVLESNGHDDSQIAQQKKEILQLISESQK